MKKTLAIILIFALSLVPSIVLSQDEVSLEEKYVVADSTLSGYIEAYADLIENRDENIEKYENMRLSRGNSFFIAKSMAAKENGILQVDFDIENMKDSVQAREAQLVIDFRTSYLNLYTKWRLSLDASLGAIEAGGDYGDSKKSYQSGYISLNDLLYDEYNKLSYENNAKTMARTYESTLMDFNLKLGDYLGFDNYDFIFTEEINELMELTFYIDYALSNSPSIKKAEQRLKKYRVEQKYYDKYYFSTNLSYISDALLNLEINTRLLELQLEKSKENLINEITDKYNAAVIDREKLDLALLNIKILQNEYDIKLSLYNRGYIEKDELSEASDNLAKAKTDYLTAIYSYNTKIKSLEYDSAYYPEESDSE